MAMVVRRLVLRSLRDRRGPMKYAAALIVIAATVLAGCAERKPAVAPEGFVNVPGGRVAYRIMGGGSKTPLIMLHGGPGGRSCVFSGLTELATDRRVILYDQLG